jgi:DNA-binding NtrC family response regulator
MNSNERNSGLKKKSASVPMRFLRNVDDRKAITTKIGCGQKPRSWQNTRGQRAHSHMKQALLLDDNIAQLTVRDLVLRKAEIESHVATKAESALALLRSEPGRKKIGVVITDHLMPDMDGSEFVRRLRSFNQEVPVIVISGLPDAETEYAGLNVIFRVKPCDPEDLIGLVRTALNCKAPA